MRAPAENPREAVKAMRGHYGPGAFFSDLERSVMAHPINNEFRLLRLAGIERRTAQMYLRTRRPDMARAKLREAYATLSQSVLARQIRKYVEGAKP